MPLDKQSTTLRQSPYNDDFDETKNFHRVLFKPSVAVQARELTQLQTILQNQIERFGDNIYQTGTIIKGCSLVTDDQYFYVKLFDLQPSGESYTIGGLVNTYVVDSTSNLTALVVNFAPGGQQLDPDLNTLYLKYLNTGAGGQKQYSNNSVLTVYDRTYRVESVTVADGGTLYSNSDIVTFASNTGSGAVGQIITYANGTIRSVSVTEHGSGYLTIPTPNITTSTGSGASLAVANYIAQVQVANSTYNASGTSSPVGKGTAIKTSDGVVYQKGHFVRVQAHEQILSKYNTTPDGVSVGFVTSEAVVNSNSDQTLLDNATGTSNYTAPGADRLKLVANLSVITTAAAASNNEFLTLYEYEDGRVVKDRTVTQFNSVSRELSRRTFEESGNYVVNQFPMYTETISGNTTHLNLVVGAGVGYVQGNRVQIVNNTRYPVRKSTDLETATTQTIATNYGGWVYGKEYMGNFDIKSGATVALYGGPGSSYRNAISAGVGIGAGSSAVQIGTARIRSITYDSGIVGTPDCLYRVYLFDVRMSSGASFKDVKSIVNSTSGVVDVVSDTALGFPTQYDAQYDKLVFDTGTFAIQQFDSEVVNVRTSNATGTFTTAGSLSFSLSGGSVFPYADGTLNSVQERDFIVVPDSSIVSTVTKTGTVAATSGSNTVTGTGTLFSTEYNVGQYIKVNDASAAGEIRLITKIISNTSLQVATNWTTSPTANTHRSAYPAYVPIDLSPASKSVTISASGGTIQVSLGHAVNNSVTATVYHDTKYVTPAVRIKTANTYYVKLSSAALGSNANGPWCLGLPDVVDVVGVYVGGASNTYANTTATNYVNEFVVDSGQTDNYYGLATLAKRPGSTLSLSSANCLTVAVKAMTHSIGSYISTESYAGAIDDASAVLPANRIRTQDIPVFVSPKTGTAYDLRNSIDFRPLAANTAAYANSVAAASIDPSSTFTLPAGDKLFPSPVRDFSATVTSYLARRDRLVIDGYGGLHMIEGSPANSPSAPVEPEGSMTIGVINVPQYPSLSAKDAADSGRPDLGVYVVPQQNRRYTMKDISDIDSRISRLEYYTLLNTLETTTKQLVLPGEANNSIERFKNGFFVDPLTDYNVSNLQDPEYRILIDANQGIARPYYADVKVDLQIDNSSSSGVVQTGDLLTLNYTEKQLLSQPIATRDRSLVDQFWRYTGNVKTVPSFDNFYDVERSAVSIAIDIASPLNQLAQATSAALSTLNVSTSLLSTANNGSAIFVGQSGSTQTFQQNIIKTYQDTKVAVNSGSVTQSNTYLGQYVNDIALQQYIREQRIGFYATGLRPGATHYVFFDNNLMTSRVTPCTVDLTLANITTSSFTSTGLLGAALVANTSGCVAGYLDVPGGTYFVGERSIVVMDVDNVASESTATSKSIGKFTAYAFNVAMTDLSVGTKTIDVAGGGFSYNTYTNNPYPIADKYTWTRTVDPLCQTFNVQPQLANTDGIYVTSVDVFFKAKDPVQGVNLEIRETNNGVPTSIVVPFSRAYKTSGQVATSTNASAATTFKFQSPVYLRTGGEYALVLYPDSNSPEYRVFSSVVGGKDLTNTNLVSNQNWGLGTMFYSTSGSAWTPVQDEDLKFTIKRAQFSSTSGTAVLHNGDYEFLTVANTSGIMRGGESVAQLHPSKYLNVVLTTSNTSSIIGTSTNLAPEVAAGDNLLFIYGTSQTQSTGNVTVTSTTITNAAGVTSTTFATDYTAGQFIKIGNSSAGEIRQIITVANNTSMTIDAPINGSSANVQAYKLSPVYQVARVVAANSSSVTIDKLPKVTTNNVTQVTVQKAVAGIVDSYNYGNNRIYISHSSSANDSFKVFTSNSSYRGTLIGDTSGATATVTSVDNVSANFFRPIFSSVVTPGTGLSLSGTLTKNSGSTDTRLYDMGMLNKIQFNDDALIKSKSNEIVGTVVTKSFSANIDFSTSSTDTSPVLDVTPVSIVVTRNLISNTTTGETTKYGDAKSKYVSKRLELATGMDAEDVKVYITAFKPSGTNVDVYAKILNSTDGDTFDNKDGTLLDQTTSPAIYSDSLDDQDYREFEYTFPRSAPSAKITGYASTNSNTTLTGVDSLFGTDIVAGDIIKVVRTSSTLDYDIVRVASVANTTSLTTSSALSFTATGCTVEKVSHPKAAFKYCRNNNVVRYLDGTGAAYDTYKYLAIKVVLRSPYNYLVPTINDVRALAVSV